ncbi:MAG: DUF1080 domain-containing protein, partial [Acidobacteria bacterium]|nr:DUF1080 domain-containing protein [Acidobacteriota bacterium]
MRLISSLLFFALAASAQTGKWINIFPDAKLTGWTRVAIPPTAQLGEASQWKVDGAQKLLVCEGNGGHDMLRYDREFDNFIFHVEWRFTKLEGDKRYNSGVFVRNDANGTIWHQAQC